MILGEVNPRTEAVIPIIIRDATGQSLTRDAVIDTGFSGYLTLPIATITILQLPFLGARVFSLGNNARANFDIYKATVLWDGQEREIKVLASEEHPLVGMSLLKGFRITIDAVDGGEVRIEPRP
jgi:clan AA aspartic protease